MPGRIVLSDYLVKKRMISFLRNCRAIAMFLLKKTVKFVIINLGFQRRTYTHVKNPVRGILCYSIFTRERRVTYEIRENVKQIK
jgi:hypothetical protein